VTAARGELIAIEGLGIVFCLLGVLVVEMFAGVRGMGYVMGSLADGFPGPRAVRGDRARVGGVDRDRSGARPPERQALALARLIPSGPGLLRPPPNS